MRTLDTIEVEAVSGSGQVAAGLALGAAALGTAGAVTRFIPGAQVLSAGLSVLGIGVGALAGVATMANL